MTFIIAGANWNYAIQVSDRRITYFDGRGRPVKRHNEENKAIFWNSPNGRIAVSYTGLARVGNTPTVQLISELLGESVEQTDGTIDAAMKHLKATLANKLSHIRAKDRRLTLIFTGFVSGDNMYSAFPGSCLMTNFQNYETGIDAEEAWDEFVTRFEYPSPDHTDRPFSLIQFAGNWKAVETEEAELLRPFLEENRPPQAFVDKAVELYDIWSARPNAHIGTQLSSIVIHFSRLNDPTWEYHTKNNSKTVRYGATVATQPGFGTLTIHNVEYTMTGEGAPIVVPKVPSSRPCPCGSGKSYRRCHGKNAGQHNK